MNMKRTVLGVLAGLLLGSTAQAALTANSIITAQTPNRGIVQFLQGTDVAGTYKTLYTAGANGSRCTGLVENNNDPSATHLVTVELVNTAVKYGGTAVTSGLGDGYLTGIPPKAFMSATNWPGLPVDQYGNPYLLMISGDTLQATFATAITSTDKINLQVSCVDF